MFDAVERSDAALVRLLLAYGATSDEDAFYHACEQSDTALLDLLYPSGFERLINHKLDFEDAAGLRWFLDRGWTSTRSAACIMRGAHPALETHRKRRSRRGADTLGRDHERRQQPAQPADPVHRRLQRHRQCQPVPPRLPRACPVGRGHTGHDAEDRTAAAFIGSGSRAQQKRREPHRMLVSFDDVGGTETVATWLNEAPRLRAIVGSLVTMRSDTIFGENRFFNVCSAAEGFHRSTIGGFHMPKTEFKSVKRMLKKYLPRRYREWFDSRMAHANDPSLNQRLKQLADQLGQVAEDLVGDVAVWVGPFPSAAMTLRTLRNCASSTTAVTCTGWRRACST